MRILNEIQAYALIVPALIPKPNLSCQIHIQYQYKTLTKLLKLQGHQVAQPNFSDLQGEHINQLDILQSKNEIDKRKQLVQVDPTQNIVPKPKQ